MGCQPEHDQSTNKAQIVTLQSLGTTATPLFSPMHSHPPSLVCLHPHLHPLGKHVAFPVTTDNGGIVFCLDMPLFN